MGVLVGLWHELRGCIWQRDKWDLANPSSSALFDCLKIYFVCACMCVYIVYLCIYMCVCVHVACMCTCVYMCMCALCIYVHVCVYVTSCLT